MAIPSVLYPIFNIRGCVLSRIERTEDAVILHAAQNPDTLRCPCCQGKGILKDGVGERDLRHGAVNGKPVILRLTTQRVWCNQCEVSRQSPIDFAEPFVRHTHAFARYALELTRHMTLKAVANHLSADEGTVKDIQKAYLKKQFGKIRLHKVKRIAIDEIYTGKKIKFLTLVLDLDTGAVVYIGNGKGVESLVDFWKKLKASGANIEAVASDMSPAFSLAIAENIPKATHVFDRFHVVKLMNEKLTVLRREVQRNAETIEQKAVLKCSRYLLLKNPENLDDSKNERQRRDDALRLNQPLFVAYYLKEKLRELWNQGTKRKADKYLDAWIQEADESGIRQMKVMAKTLLSRRAGMLAWYDHPISTGRMEGTNNKVGAINRQAYGYRDEEFFRLKIHAAHLSSYKLVG